MLLSAALFTYADVNSTRNVIPPKGRSVLSNDDMLQLLRVLFCPHSFDAKLVYAAIRNICAHERSATFVLSAALAVLAQTEASVAKSTGTKPATGGGAARLDGDGDGDRDASSKLDVTPAVARRILEMLLILFRTRGRSEQVNTRVTR